MAKKTTRISPVDDAAVDQDAEARRAKVEEIKQRIAEGTYKIQLDEFISNFAKVLASNYR